MSSLRRQPEGPSAARTLPLALLACAAAGAALADAGTDSPQVERQQWLIELKRQASERGTLEEATKTNLKIDHFLDGPVSLLRVELPFPDSKGDSLEGRPLDPEFGDSKVRAGFRAVEFAGRPFTSFVEFTFPTADPESQGTGKHQWSGGVKTAISLGEGIAYFGPSRRSFSAQIEQVVSFGGDRSRDDINQTKFELEWRDAIAGGHWAMLKAKPVVDWAGGGQTGGVLELEGGWAMDRTWSFALLAGGLLWGKGTPGTYQTRAELKAICRF